MPPAVKHSHETSFVSILSGWAQQGVQSFFATQRILLDLAMRQNASVMHALREQLTNTHHSPTAIMSEMAGEGMTNFIEGQKVLLDLGQQQNQILMSGVKERIGNWPAAHAMTDLLQRSVETFIHMQREFLKIAGKQTHTWVEAAKAGKPYPGDEMLELAREGMENFIKAQKQFLDVIAEEAAKATSGKPSNGMEKKIKTTDLPDLARKATDSFIEAQKRLVEVAGRQVSTGVKGAGKTMDLLRPFPFLPVGDLTREVVKSYVDAQKSLMEVVVRPTAAAKHGPKPEHKAKRPTRKAKAATAAAVA